jgi:hypothetical protein
MNRCRSLTFDDDRTGDTYTIYLTSEGQFESAHRFIDRVGSNPIVYNTIESIPESHRNDIINKIWQSRTK